MGARAFILGTLTGAASLAIAAYIDDARTEAKFSPELKTPANLDKEQVVRELNNYYFKTQDILVKCNDILARSSAMIAEPVVFPWDNFLQKTVAGIGGKLNVFCRKNYERQLLWRKEDAEKLYKRYRGVFKRAVTLASEMGRDFKKTAKKLYDPITATVNCDLDNDDWITELEELGEQIIKPMEQSCETANTLIAFIEGETESA